MIETIEQNGRPEQLKPIPLELLSVEGWKDIPIVENNEPLVPLGSCSSYSDIFTN